MTVTHIETSTGRLVDLGAPDPETILIAEHADAPTPGRPAWTAARRPVDGGGRPGPTPDGGHPEVRKLRRARESGGSS